HASSPWPCAGRPVRGVLIRRAVPGRLARRGASGEPDASNVARMSVHRTARAPMSASPRETARRAGLVLGIVSICLGAVLGVTAVAASAKQPTFPKAFSPVATENTYDGNEDTL